MIEVTLSRISARCCREGKHAMSQAGLNKIDIFLIETAPRAESRFHRRTLGIERSNVSRRYG